MVAKLSATKPKSLRPILRSPHGGKRELIPKKLSFDMLHMHAMAQVLKAAVIYGYTCKYLDDILALHSSSKIKVIASPIGPLTFAATVSRPGS